MAPSLADRSNTALAAAMSRHPAAGARATFPAPAEAPSFATVAALLTGPWRVNDPVSFAAAMRAAPLVAGYPVVDLCACARQPTVQLDPLSAAIAGHLESAVGAAAERSGLNVRWVAAVGGRFLFVEAAGRAPADTEGPALHELAHLVEPAEVGPRPTPRGRSCLCWPASSSPPRSGPALRGSPRSTTTRGSWLSWATGGAA